jgi:hypothetical protein
MVLISTLRPKCSMMDLAGFRASSPDAGGRLL